MKKFILLSSLVLATPSFADQLQSYDEITAALTTGKSIHVVTDFAQCSTANKAAVKTMSMAIFTPNEIGIMSDHVAMSLNHFTINDPYFPGKSVYEFVRYTITPDNNMNVSLQVLDAVTYASLMDKISYNCKINTATKIYL
jgi:hypothetical protein